MYFQLEEKLDFDNKIILFQWRKIILIKFSTFFYAITFKFAYSVPFFQYKHMFIILLLAY